MIFVCYIIVIVWVYFFSFFKAAVEIFHGVCWRIWSGETRIPNTPTTRTRTNENDERKGILILILIFYNQLPFTLSILTENENMDEIPNGRGFLSINSILED
ncbi:hypothetical protein Ddye_005943 [Dipteronia dyeriana]|uniref:Uncharacterized protein n=1 Tax=Dipteronia dyeriana TaxID=168575 RepID=A0AAE0CQ36_9ROSI|nr:hypothetical protein Ddye_005943 [Dipteronia dyeriana]